MTSEFNYYMISLNPQKMYFFGNEQTFGEENEVNYYAKSNLFPAQTTLLGMLRFQLLQQNGLISDGKITKPEEAIKLIGEKSFPTENSGRYGVINRISPLLIHDGNDFFYFSNKEFSPNLNADGTILNKKVALIPNRRDQQHIRFYYNNEKAQNFPNDIIHFEPKKGFEKCLKGLIDPDKVYKFEHVFNSYSKVGIDINKQGFYKQDFWGLASDFKFVFILECSKSLPFELHSALVQMGGEKSIFKMEVTDSEHDIETLFPDYQSNNTSQDTEIIHEILLLSDVYTDNSIYDACLFANTESIDFRHISTRINDTKNYAAKPKKSYKYNLLKRGSILYTKNPLIITKKINENETFKQIGFNYYTIKKILTS